MIIINSSNTHTFNSIPVNAGIRHAPQIKVEPPVVITSRFIRAKNRASILDQPSTFISGMFTSVLNKGIRIHLCTDNPSYNTSPITFTHTNVFCL